MTTLFNTPSSYWITPLGNIPQQGAVISNDELYRYVLSRTWDPTLPPLVWCMLNPSTADAHKDDPTIRKCMGFARRLGHGGIVVVNLFAYRATNPDVLKKNAAAVDIVGPDNDLWIQRAAMLPTKTIVCGWGDKLASSPRISRVVSLVQEAGGILYALKLTTHSQQPGHPLYIPYETPMTEWRSQS